METKMGKMIALVITACVLAMPASAGYDCSPYTGACYPQSDPPPLYNVPQYYPPPPTYMPRSDSGPDLGRALTGAANLVLYYNECDKVPDSQVPLATKKVLRAAMAVFGEDAIQRKAAEIVEEREGLGMSVAKWCLVFGHLISPEFRRR
jgi:hypothetical protein